MTITLLHGDCRELLTTLPDQSVQCVITSPPYYGLRKYTDDAREIGGESTPDCRMVDQRRIIGVTPMTDEDGITYYLPTYETPKPCGARHWTQRTPERIRRGVDSTKETRCDATTTRRVTIIGRDGQTWSARRGASCRPIISIS